MNYFSAAWLTVLFMYVVKSLKMCQYKYLTLILKGKMSIAQSKRTVIY